MTLDIPRILLIDSYDSFTFNLAALIKAAIPKCSIHIIKNDDYTIPELLPNLQYFSAVVVGPGPGSPDNPRDIGVVKDLWRIPEDNLLPVFGVCLGLQSLCIEHGAVLKRLAVVKHGQISTIFHSSIHLFSGAGNVEAVRYHSLHVHLAPGGEIEQLAWADDGKENGHVVMAVRHISRPFWAVQYHPESVRTDQSGVLVMENFWKLGRAWNTKRNRLITPIRASDCCGTPWPNPYPFLGISSSAMSPTTHSSSYKVVQLRHFNLATMCEAFGAADDSSPFVLLDSAASPGRFSILACLTGTSPQITYFLDDSFVCVKQGTAIHQFDLPSRDIWTWLSTFMRDKRVEDGCPEVPFWGGLVGMLSYGLGVQNLGISEPPKREQPRSSRHPDVNLAFVERSIVVDAASNRVYVQSLIADDDDWLEETVLKVQAASETTQTSPSLSNKPSSPQPILDFPDKESYLAHIGEAQAHLNAGDSYELCLTAQTRITAPSCSSWDRYRTLRSKNPAPHAAFIRLNPTTFLSSSPERFLSFSRPPNSLCQLRPIKGTVRKAPGIIRLDAEKALSGSAKEVAENLMIVDLIRHDLHSVVGEDVVVTKFCGLEEYETVWQLVSVIEGKLPNNCGSLDGQLGWQVLKNSLPPGSMTGAPKKRSVEILRALEGTERGLYSGVFGYWCVGGGGDWAVTIRTCFKHQGDDPRPSTSVEEWTVGAGGAITALSDPDSEWEEMLVKLQSVLRSFDHT
ncbi:ADC synthase [Mycena floridula]|nr:ADC synthase [Mycena floridula]